MGSVMKNVAFLFPVVLCQLLSAAHFLRSHDHIIVAFFLLSIFLVFIKRAIAARLIQMLLTFATLVWVYTAHGLAMIRIDEGRPWIRLVVILSIVIALNVLAVFVLQTNTMKKRFRLAGDMNGQISS